MSEAGMQLCVQTPCTVTYRGADARSDVAHRLVFARHGYSTETVTLTSTQSEARVVLQQGSRHSSGHAKSGASAPASAAVPHGFKETPY